MPARKKPSSSTAPTSGGAAKAHQTPSSSVGQKKPSATVSSRPSSSSLNSTARAAATERSDAAGDGCGTNDGALHTDDANGECIPGLIDDEEGQRQQGKRRSVPLASTATESRDIAEPVSSAAADHHDDDDDDETAVVHAPTPAAQPTAAASNSPCMDSIPIPRSAREAALLDLLRGCKKVSAHNAPTVTTSNSKGAGGGDHHHSEGGINSATRGSNTFSPTSTPKGALSPTPSVVARAALGTSDEDANNINTNNNTSDPNSSPLSGPAALPAPCRARFALWSIVYDQIQQERIALEQAGRLDMAQNVATMRQQSQLSPRSNLDASDDADGNPLVAPAAADHNNIDGDAPTPTSSTASGVSAYTMIDLHIQEVLRHLATPAVLGLLRRGILLGEEDTSNALRMHVTGGGGSIGAGGGPSFGSGGKGSVSATKRRGSLSNSVNGAAPTSSCPSSGSSSWLSWGAGGMGWVGKGGHRSEPFLRASSAACLVPAAARNLPFALPLPPIDAQSAVTPSSSCGFGTPSVRAEAWRILLLQQREEEPTTATAAATAHDTADPSTAGEDEGVVYQRASVPSLEFMMRRELAVLRSKIAAADAQARAADGGDDDGASPAASPMSSTTPQLRTASTAFLPTAPADGAPSAQSLLLGKVTGVFPPFVPEQVIYNDIERSLWVLYPEEEERTLRRRELKECLLRILLSKGGWGLGGEDNGDSPAAPYRPPSAAYHYYQGLHEVLGHILHVMQLEAQEKRLNELGTKSNGNDGTAATDGTAPRVATAAEPTPPEAFEDAIVICEEAVRRCFAPMCAPSLLHSEAMLRAMHFLLVKEDPELAKLLERVTLGPSNHYAVSWLLTWFSHEVEKEESLYTIFDMLLCMSRGRGGEDGGRAPAPPPMTSVQREANNAAEEASGMRKRGGGSGKSPQGQDAAAASAVSETASTSASTASAAAPAYISSHDRFAADDIIYWCAAVMLIFSDHIKTQYHKMVAEERASRHGMYGHDHDDDDDDDDDDDEEEHVDASIHFGILYSLVAKLPRSIMATPMAVRDHLRERVRREHERRMGGGGGGTNNANGASPASAASLSAASPLPHPSLFSVTNDCFSVVEVLEVVCRLRCKYPNLVPLVQVCEQHMIGANKGIGIGRGMPSPAYVGGATAGHSRSNSTATKRGGSSPAAAAALALTPEQRLDADLEAVFAGRSVKAVLQSSFGEQVSFFATASSPSSPTVDVAGGGSPSSLKKATMSATVVGLVMVSYLFTAYTTAATGGGLANPPKY